MIGLIVSLAASPSSSSSTGSSLFTYLMLGGLLVVFYFLLIRPQRANQRKQRELMSAVEPGDEVLTTSGLFGIVREVEEDSVVIEISEGVEVRFLKQAISRRLTEPEPAARGDDDAKEADGAK